MRVFATFLSGRQREGRQASQLAALSRSRPFAIISHTRRSSCCCRRRHVRLNRPESKHSPPAFAPLCCVCSICRRPSATEVCKKIALSLSLSLRSQSAVRRHCGLAAERTRTRGRRRTLLPPSPSPSVAALKAPAAVQVVQAVDEEEGAAREQRLHANMPTYLQLTFSCYLKRHSGCSIQHNAFGSEKMCCD